MRELEIEAKVENLNEVFTFIDEHLEKLGCPVKTQMQIDVAVDELFSNVAMYAYKPTIGKIRIAFDVENACRTVYITFCDSGIPYNPLEKADPDITLSADERDIGGLGIYMVKKTMDRVEYKYENGCNMLTIVKNI